MLHDEVWLSIADSKTCLCLNHTERRLGREIILADLKPCAMNELAIRLLSRIEQK